MRRGFVALLAVAAAGKLLAGAKPVGQLQQRPKTLSRTCFANPSPVPKTSSCWLRGSDEIVNHIKSKLNIEVGETSADGMFTLKTVECLGSCGTAPMLQCGADFHENLTIEKVDELIEKKRAKNERSSYLKSMAVNN